MTEMNLRCNLLVPIFAKAFLDLWLQIRILRSPVEPVAAQPLAFGQWSFR